MRVTFNSLNRHVQHVIQQRYGDLASLQEQLSTGRRLMRPSDDPTDVANDLKLRSRIKEVAQFKKNLDDGIAFMGVTDTAMQSMNTLLQRCRELSIQAANDTLSEKERLFIQKEVGELTRQLLGLANTSYKGDYVFGGTQTKVEPYPLNASAASDPEDYATMKMAYYDASAVPLDTPVQIYDAFYDDPITNIFPGSFKLVSPDSGGAMTTWVEGTDYTVDYVVGTITILSTGSDPAALAVDVSDNHQFSAGANGYYNALSPNRFSMTFEFVDHGRDIYGDQVTSTGDIVREFESGITSPINISGTELFTDQATGVNAIAAFIRFNQNLLNSDTQGIERGIDEFDTVMTTILSAQSKNGARINRFETSVERNELQYTETTRLQSEIEDADIAETVMKFKLTESVYNAALQSAATVIKPTLANFL